MVILFAITVDLRDKGRRVEMKLVDLISDRSIQTDDLVDSRR